MPPDEMRPRGHQTPGNATYTEHTGPHHHDRAVSDLRNVLGKSQAAVEARCHGLRPGGGSRVSDHQSDHRPFDHGLTGLRESLVVMVEAAAFDDPGERALDHPSPWKYVEFFIPKGLRTISTVMWATRSAHSTSLPA